MLTDIIALVGGIALIPGLFMVAVFIAYTVEWVRSGGRKPNPLKQARRDLNRAMHQVDTIMAAAHEKISKAANEADPFGFSKPSKWL